MIDPGLDGSVEPPPGLPHHECTTLSGPVGDIVVVAHDCNRQGGRRVEHTCCHGTGELAPLRRSQGAVEAPLRLVERFDRYEDGPCAQAETPIGLVHSGVGHVASVGTRWWRTTRTATPSVLSCLTALRYPRSRPTSRTGSKRWPD